jgi:Flp pilus assembly protein TadG
MTRRNHQHGALVLEMGIVGAIFIMLILGVMDFSRIYYCQSTLKYAVSQGARFATTGGALEDENEELLTREESIVLMIRELAGFSDFADDDIYITAVTSGGATVVGPGGPGDVVTVRAEYRVDVLSPYLYHFFTDGRYTFEAVTTFRNEEFPEA